MATELYKKMNDLSKEYQERNDCTVIAIGIATRCGYRRAHRLLEAYGRKPGKGCRVQEFLAPLLDALDCDARKIKLPEGLTARTVTWHLRRSKRYLVFVRGHVLAVADGEVQDWTAGRRHRVKDVYEVSFRKPGAKV